MPVRYVLADIDDTIVATNGTVPPCLYNGLQKLSWIIAKANLGQLPPFGFCTGREASYVLGIARFMEIPNSWSLVESGLLLYNPRSQDRKYHPALTQEMREVFEEIKKKRIPLLVAKFPFLFPYTDKEVNIAIERRDEAVSLKDCEQVIREALQNLVQFLEINVSSIAVDISPKGIDKGTGLIFLAEETGIPPSEMLLIDDSMGGKPAADHAGFLACPANAKPEFKELVRARGEKGYESPFEFAEGVADSILHFTGVRTS